MIHPQAVIDPKAKLADDVEVGPFTFIGPDVEIGSGTVIHSHAVIKGPTTIGKNNEIFQFATVGEATTDMKYKGEPTRLEIGDNNIIREGVTIHRGTVQDRSLTKIGDNNLLMAYVHVGHDCFIGSNCIFVNNASMAGHVEVGDWAILSGYTLIHQFSQIGAHSFVGMGAGVKHDVPAYVTVFGFPAEAKTINAEGLRRRGFSAEAITNIRRAYKVLYRQGLTTEEAVEKLAEMATQHPEVGLLYESVKNSRRGICR